MRVLLKAVLAAGVFVGVSAAVLAAEFEGLKESMSEQEFERAGLDKLDAAELAALDDWIAGKMPPVPAADATAQVPVAAPAGVVAPAVGASVQEPVPAPAEVAAPAVKKVVPPEPAAAPSDAAIAEMGLINKTKDLPKSFRSRIAGEFRGWQGETVFRLENGQVWKQRMDGTWSTRMDSPEIEIRRGFMGFYRLKVIETGRWIGVKRVE